MGKLSRQEVRAMEEERAEQLRAEQENGEEKVRSEDGGGMRERINWADVEHDGHFGGRELWGMNKEASTSGKGK